ncbi:hypothetical protein ACX9GQ_10820 [Alsobacter sp. R-9]
MVIAPDALNGNNPRAERTFVPFNLDHAARRLARRFGLPRETALLVADLVYGEVRHG